MPTLPTKSKRAAAAGVWLTLIALAGSAVAATQEQSLPVNIQSNNAEFAQKTGRSVYTGDVRLTRAGLTLTGNKLVLTNVQDRGQLHAVLTGSPAHIDKQPDQDGDDHITGHSDKIVFDNPKQTVSMHGDAILTRANGDQVTGQTITHYLDTDRTTAQRGSKSHERVKVTLHPKNKGSGQ